jgi:hypothetical protein
MKRVLNRYFQFVNNAGANCTDEKRWEQPSRVVENATLDNVKGKKVFITVLPGFWTNPPPTDKEITTTIEEYLEIAK